MVGRAAGVWPRRRAAWGVLGGLPRLRLRGFQDRLQRLGTQRAEVVDRFHEAFYADGLKGGTWADMRFLGVPIRKNPFDLWIYQELIAEIRPDLVIESGTRFGGSAYYFARLLDLLGTGRVVTIDTDGETTRPEHPRITYLTGSSTSEQVLADVRKAAAASERVLVSLDADHSASHVLDELHAYSPLVTPGSYIVVEDTNVNGHPVDPTFGPGPMEAVESFLAETTEFEVDQRCERFLFTFNPKGYLRRRSGST
jgi:cephalosporin hydroxylase